MGQPAATGSTGIKNSQASGTLLKSVICLSSSLHFLTSIAVDVFDGVVDSSLNLAFGEATDACFLGRFGGASVTGGDVLEPMLTSSGLTAGMTGLSFDFFFPFDTLFCAAWASISASSCSSQSSTEGAGDPFVFAPGAGFSLDATTSFGLLRMGDAPFFRGESVGGSLENFNLSDGADLRALGVGLAAVAGTTARSGVGAGLDVGGEGGAATRTGTTGTGAESGMKIGAEGGAGARTVARVGTGVVSRAGV